jgi:hypothetical protein
MYYPALVVAATAASAGASNPLVDAIFLAARYAPAFWAAATAANWYNKPKKDAADGDPPPPAEPKITLEEAQEFVAQLSEEHVKELLQLILDHLNDEQGKHLAAIVEAAQDEGKGHGMTSKIKSLYDVGQLASLLSELGYLAEWSKFDAELDRTASKVPGMLAAALHGLGDALLAMTEEEVGKLIARVTVNLADTDADDMAYVAAAKTPLAKVFRAARVAKGAKRVKGGKVLSAENETALQNAHDCASKAMEHCKKACEHVKCVLDKAAIDPEDPEHDPDDTDFELAGDPARRKRLHDLDLLQLSDAT